MSELSGLMLLRMFQMAQENEKKERSCGCPSSCPGGCCEDCCEESEGDE